VGLAAQTPPHQAASQQAEQDECNARPAPWKKRKVGKQAGEIQAAVQVKGKVVRSTFPRRSLPPAKAVLDMMPYRRSPNHALPGTRSPAMLDGQRSFCLNVSEDGDMRFGPIAAMALWLTACEGRDAVSDASLPEAPPRHSPSMSTPDAGRGSREGWDLQSSGEGVALALLGHSGGTVIRLFCPSGEKSLLVNVSSFRPIGSEERLSFGSGSQAVALVADPRGDAQRGGVSGTGAVPGNLMAVLGGSLSASYGAQTSGPHAAPPPKLSQPFVAACHEGSAAARQSGSPSGTSASACLMQGGERLRVSPIRAVGTEPFWGARVEGRCVRYSNPEDQDGTRVWTRYTDTGDGGTWSGAMDGRPFELRIRAQPGCSDGMSDKRYPLAVELLVRGEQRRGCAERP